MAEWRLFTAWSGAALKSRLESLPHKYVNFDEVNEAEMTGARGWHHYHSEALIARGDDVDARFARAKTELANYEVSDPTIVVAHFDPAAPLLHRRLLLEIKIWGLRYLCPAYVRTVRDEVDLFACRYDTLDGHIEQGVEWFILSKAESGDIRFRIEARWLRGSSPTGGAASASSWSPASTSDAGTGTHTNDSRCWPTMDPRSGRRATPSASPIRGST